MHNEIFSILLVDDDEVDLDLMKRSFGRISPNCQVQTTTDPTAVTNLLATVKFDFVVSDYLMPNLDGIQLLKKIRSEGYTTPFILITGYGDETVAKEAVRAGANYYVRKGDSFSSFLVEELLFGMEKIRQEQDTFLQLKNTNAMLHSTVKELELTNTLNKIFLTYSDDQMYAEVMTVVLGVMQSKFGFFGYIDDESNLVSSSLTRDVWDQCTIPDKSIIFKNEEWAGLWGDSLRSKTSAFKNSSLNVPEGHIQLSNALVVPILYQNELIGMLAVANRESGEYSEQDQFMLENIAKSIAPVLKARLEKAQEEKTSQDLRVQLKRTSERYKSIFDYIPSMVLVLDGEFKIIEYNEQAQVLLDKLDPLDENDSYPFVDLFFATSERPLLQAELTRVLTEKVSIHSKHKLNILGEDELTYYWIFSPLMEENQTNEVIAIGVDVSDLEFVKEELSNLANVVHHDIRNSLTNISMYLSLLEEGHELTPTEVIRRVRKQLSLIEDIFSHSLSLAELGKSIEKSEESLSLVDIIADSLRNVIPPNVRVIEDYKTKPYRHLDRLRAYQLFKNIFENAVKHGGATEVEVRVEQTLEGVVVSVANDGIAIPETMVERILRGKTGGIGSSMIKQVVEGHGWGIEIVSNPRTTYIITIP